MAAAVQTSDAKRIAEIDRLIGPALIEDVAKTLGYGPVGRERLGALEIVVAENARGWGVQCGEVVPSRDERFSGSGIATTPNVPQAHHGAGGLCADEFSRAIEGSRLARVEVQVAEHNQLQRSGSHAGRPSNSTVCPILATGRPTSPHRSTARCTISTFVGLSSPM